MPDSDKTPLVMTHAQMVAATAMPLLALYELLLDKKLISKDEAVAAVEKYHNRTEADGSDVLTNSVMKSIASRLKDRS